jgi:hypothetical protein
MKFRGGMLNLYFIGWLRIKILSTGPLMLFFRASAVEERKILQGPRTPLFVIISMNNGRRL